MDLEGLYGFSLGLDLLDHFGTDHRVQTARPVVGALFGGRGLTDHSVQKDLNHDEQILMREEHEVLQRCINLVFHLWVHVRV